VDSGDSFTRPDSKFRRSNGFDLKRKPEGYSVELKYHVMVDEREPFALYAVEIHSAYSRRILKKNC
jgi:hypothetical protein